MYVEKILKLSEYLEGTSDGETIESSFDRLVAISKKIPKQRIHLTLSIMGTINEICQVSCYGEIFSFDEVEDEGIAEDLLNEVRVMIIENESKID